MDRTQQEAIADLFGLAARPAPGTSFRLADVNLAVRELTGRPLEVVLVELFGPIGDARAARASAADERAALWAWFSAHPVVRARELEDWIADVRAAGIRGSAEATLREDLVASQRGSAGPPGSALADGLSGGL
ncbi:hypothetical protein ASG23_06790 [Cellulomonas sp. Leaf395]|nr:hypothetical protein ASG23_06790 [Cellulomonas sp. Leaf395]